MAEVKWAAWGRLLSIGPLNTVPPAIIHWVIADPIDGEYGVLMVAGEDDLGVPEEYGGDSR